MKLRRLALLGALVLLFTSCGQKPGVEFSAAGPAEGAGGSGSATTRAGAAATTRAGGGGAAPTTRAGGGGATPTTAAAGGAPTTTAADGGGGGGGGDASTTTAADGSTPSTEPGAGGPTETGPTSPTDPGTGGTEPTEPTTGGPPPAGDRTGISDDKIIIGIHAPVTGAAPIRQDSFDIGKDIYWHMINDRGGVFGRRVEVVFRDDKFDPSSARGVCEEMVQQEHAFLLIGGAGADQITACADYAASAGVPYISAGVNEDGITGLSTYFALSMTYAQQSPLLAQLINNQLQKKKIGIVVLRTPSFLDAQASFTEAAQGLGLDIVVNKTLEKDAGPTEALATANELRSKGAEAVYVLLSPTVFLYLGQAAGNQGYTPIYVGPGVSNGINAVAELGCPSIAGARFLSPFPQTDVIDQLDPDYQMAYRQYAGQDGDDIGIALWGLNKTLHKMFEAAGKDMTRESFIQTLTGGAEFASGVFPPVSYSAENRFGGTQAHLLEADCGSRTFKTVAQFASGF